MTRSFRRFVGACVAVGLAATGAFAQVRSTDPPPDYATLKRLADQLGAGGQGQIDPKMLDFAQEFMKNNPDFLKDPRVQQQMAEMQKRFQQDPNLAENMKRQMNLTPEQLEAFRQQFQSQGGIGGGGGRMTNPNPFGLPSGGEQGEPNPPPPVTGSGQGPEQGQPKGTNPGAGVQELPGVTPQGGSTQPEGNGGQIGNPNPGQVPGVGNSQSLDQMKQLAQQNQEFNQLVGTWEANFGSLDNTPALRQAFIDMYSGGGGNWTGGSGKPFDWNGGGSGVGGSGNWSGGSGSGGGGMAQWFNNVTSNGGPSWWKSMTGGSSGKSWFSGWNTGGGGGASSYTPSVGGGGIGSVGGLGGGFAGLGTAGMVIVGLIAAAVIAFLVYRYWPAIAALRRPPTPLPGAGPWPIDPRDVKDRESLVRAFEYLSVFICGDGARVWNHVTIADAFRENVPGAAGIADPLARLYAVARYTPAREEISPADIAEARRHLCRLAGVSEA